jgi:hypothetical protein
LQACMHGLESNSARCSYLPLPAWQAPSATGACWPSEHSFHQDRPVLTGHSTLYLRLDRRGVVHLQHKAGGGDHASGGALRRVGCSCACLSDLAWRRVGRRDAGCDHLRQQRTRKVRTAKRAAQRDAHQIVGNVHVLVGDVDGGSCRAARPPATLAEQGQAVRGVFCRQMA